MQFNGNNDLKQMKFSSAGLAKRFLPNKCCSNEQSFECNFRLFPR